jgi:hypothetical protein
MRTALMVAQGTLLVCGGLLLVLGIVIWTGNGDGLIGLHVVIGLALVLTLWSICAMAAVAGVSASTVAFAAAWGLLVIAFGLVQEGVLAGSWHWAVQVLHVAISMGGIWWGRRLARLVRRAQSTAGQVRSRGPITAGPR